ncbi:MAG: hypothetical protein ACI9J3_000830 [Parvicellaceae bacterium]|jgi:hypothetical protein
MIVGELREFFVHDKVSLCYNGNFDDSYTEKIIYLSESDLTKKSRKRMSFLVAESFQNIVRHGNEELLAESATVFGVRRLDPFLHVFSSNVVDSETKTSLETKLKRLEGMDRDSLKAMYRSSLQVGGLNDKGGAGLGLIEMARKSTQDLKFSFEAKSDQNFGFNLQVDLLLDGQEDKVDKPSISISDNTDLHRYIEEKEIIFLLKTSFTDDLTTPLLKMLKGNTGDAMGAVGYAIYHTAVEMIQNIVRHGQDINDQREGLFCLLKSDRGYTLCTGNYIRQDSKVEQWINFLNAQNKEELKFLYRKGLIESSENNKGNSAGIGMIDVRRKSNEPFEFQITNLKNGKYLEMYIEIVVD